MKQTYSIHSRLPHPSSGYTVDANNRKHDEFHQLAMGSRRSNGHRLTPGQHPRADFCAHGESNAQRALYGRLVQADRTWFVDEDIEAARALVATDDASPDRSGSGSGSRAGLALDAVNHLLSRTTAAALRGLERHGLLAAVDRLAQAGPAACAVGWVN